MISLEFWNLVILTIVGVFAVQHIIADEVIGCGGFIKSEVEINLSLIKMKLYTKQGSLAYQTDVAPYNGYYMVPVYDKGGYLLRVEAPVGWTFDPHTLDLLIDGKTDQCSRGEDINFHFSGFGVIGKVVSKGQESGPSGVILSLQRSGTQEEIERTMSIVGGSFSFKSVLPGDYMIKASHPKYLFETSSLTLKVQGDTVDTGSAIAVIGYDIEGTVVSDGQPVQGVQLILFSPETGSSVPKLNGCTTLPNLKDLNELPTVSGFSAVCEIKSSASGSFIFKTVPTGHYLLVPFYKGDHMKFDVLPEKLDLFIEHESVVIKEPFRVAGFSVTGVVRAVKSGRGISNAKVIIDGKISATTNGDGVYHLDGMTAGTYEINVEAPLVTFDVAVVRITPNTPQLPDIIASRFKVCGSVLIDRLPDGVKARSDRSVIFKDHKEQLYAVASVKADGQFCSDCQPGKYFVSVEVSNAEKQAGLKLAPERKEIIITDHSINDITFSQFSAKISGIVHCLDRCATIQLSLEAIDRGDYQRTFKNEESKKQEIHFIFEDVMPGKYKVILLSRQECWNLDTIDIEVTDKDLLDINFSQVGFSVSCTASHNMKLEFEQQDVPGNNGSFSLTKGVNKFCLSRPGIYAFHPVSCHKFENEIYQYNTSSPSVIIFTASSHLVEGVVKTKQNVSDIVINVKSSLSDLEAYVLEPLVVDSELTTKNNDSRVAPVSQLPFNYKFIYWAKAGEALTFIATSSQLLFSPDTVQITVTGDTCPGVAVTFEGRSGIYVEGQIHPPLSSVQITITYEIERKIEVFTGDDGSFRVGPLDGDAKYEITAVREGYVFTPFSGQQGHFKSYKLGEISVEVRDDVGQPLNGVLFSLSGSNNYRSSNISHDNGIHRFLNLSPGQYFLKPMMKEYEFEPASKIIDILDGTIADIQIAGRRVAFSCYGSVASLNGEPEPGIYLEALGHLPYETCGQHQEESKTELDGTFRFRGLLPNCEYLIQLKSQHNSHIERSIPKIRKIQVSNANLHNINITALRVLNQMDINGIVISPKEFLGSLKVNLFSYSSFDLPLHSVDLGSVAFFHLPSVPIDSQSYILKLTSSLSKVVYDYTLDQVQFVANTSFKHFMIKFNPKKRNIEQEINHSSFLVLPLAIIILCLTYNYQKIIPVARQLADSMHTYRVLPINTAMSSERQDVSPDNLQGIQDILADNSTVKKRTKAKRT